MAEYKVGNIVKGTVSGIETYGAFINFDEYFLFKKMNKIVIIDVIKIDKISTITIIFLVFFFKIISNLSFYYNT